MVDKRRISNYYYINLLFSPEYNEREELIQLYKKLVLLFLSTFIIFSYGCGESTIPSSNSDNDNIGSKELRQVTDMAGRQVAIPIEINTAFSTGAPGTILLYSIDPSLLVGVNYEFNENEKEFLVEEVSDLPSYGQFGGINLEALVAASPDLCISFGSISEKEIEDINSIQGQTGIPFIIIDGSLEASAEAYRFMGDILMRQDRCEDLAQYAEKAIKRAKSLNIPENKRIPVFFGNGNESLETAPLGSPHAELFELVGADNVATVEGIENNVARMDISAEQIIGWDPQVIIINGEPSKNLSPADAVKKFTEDKRYRNVRAVLDKKVYPIPKYPFSWFDRPPGINRLIGIYWLANLLYPEETNIDLDEVSREYYSLFYHIELSQNQLDNLLGK